MCGSCQLGFRTGLFIASLGGSHDCGERLRCLWVEHPNHLLAEVDGDKRVCASAGLPVEPNIDECEQLADMPWCAGKHPLEPCTGVGVYVDGGFLITRPPYVIAGIRGRLHPRRCLSYPARLRKAAERSACREEALGELSCALTRRPFELV
jgi:hypothetical protein